MTDSQVLGDEEVEAMVTSENERTGIMEVDEDDDEEEDEGEGEAHENDEEEEAEVSAHVGSGSASIVRAGMPVPHSIANGDTDAHPTASSQGSSSAPNSEHSASRNPIVVDSDSEDDGEQEDGTDMEIEDEFGGASSRVGTATRGSGPALSGKRKRRSHA